MGLHPDYRDILAAFAAHDVDYLVVGGYAVGVHGRPRYTKDLDLWVRPTDENLARVRAALQAFGAPEALLRELQGASPEDVLWMLARGELTEGHARAILAVPDDDSRRRLARRVARDGMTVRAAERAAQEGGAKRRPRATPVDPMLAERARAAAQRLTGLPARVSAGKLELHFGDETGLAELIEALEAL